MRVDYQNRVTVSVSGYSKLWRWSREKVRTFLDQMGFEITYPQDTHRFKKQWGYLQKRHKTSHNIKRVQTKKDIKHKERHKTLNNTERLQRQKDIRPDTTILYKSIDKDTPRRPPTREGAGAPVKDVGDYIFVNGERFPKTARASTELCAEGIKKRLLEKNGKPTNATVARSV